MLRILIIFLLIFLALRFLFKYALPFFAHLVAKNMKDQPNGQPKGKEDISGKKDDDQGKYIDYEEVKDK